ncbi:hypothetical protein CVD28_11540 [Bacillus sp. M6-12]|uniref:hypothetical protein n=1 Tax=Bacillus sp. M6-12 TaxID=2054166 RepID=UPI000C75C63F|nr:hypothetical protein [Bacillus sp. M6-12]PLS17619.1 hypothetical protein CVD28_11540 [Bacillus sp. M6-12]
MDDLKISYSVYCGSEKVSFVDITDLCNHELAHQIKQKVNDCDLKLKEKAILHLVDKQIGKNQNNIQVTFKQTKRESPL